MADNNPFDEIPAGCYSPDHWLIANGGEPLPESFGDFGDFGDFGEEDENKFSPLESFKPPASDKLSPFPEQHLPMPIWDMTAAASENLQVAGDMMGTNILAACAICVQGTFKINPKPGWIEPLNLYALTIARPSERKSPVQRIVTKPIKDFENEENLRRKPQIDAWKAKKRILEGKIKQTEKKAIDGKKGVSEDQILRLQAQLFALEQNEEKPLKLYADDVTPEALISLLARYNGKMAVVSSEGGIFDIAAGRYSDKANLDVFTKAYSGDPIRVNRINRPEETVQDPALTLMLMAQPSVLEDIMGNADFSGQGFLARFLYSLPASPVGRRRYETAPIPPEVLEAYSGLLRSLLELKDNNGEARIITLSPEAHQKAKAFAEALEVRLVDDLEPIEEWAGKFHGQVMRIAGILHCCKWLDEADTVPLELETMQRAEAIGNYYLEHALAAFRLSGLCDPPEVKDAKYILKRLDSTGKTEIKKRDLYHLCQKRTGMETVEGMDPGLNELVRRGYIRIESDPALQNLQNLQKSRGRGRPPSPMIYVNPEYTKLKEEGK